MAYDKEKLTNVGQVEEALKRSVAKFADKEEVAREVSDLEEEIKKVEDIGGEPNKIDSISVNDEVQEIDEDKNVNITVPTKTSEIENDSTYQTKTEVDLAIETAITEINKMTVQVADEVPDPAEAEPDVFYLVHNDDTGHYDIYMLIDGVMVRLDDTTIDLTDYVTDEALEAALANYYTKTEIDEAYEDVLREEDIISDEDFKEMLNSVFGEGEGGDTGDDA